MGFFTDEFLSKIAKTLYDDSTLQGLGVNVQLGPLRSGAYTNPCIMVSFDADSKDYIGVDIDSVVVRVSLFTDEDSPPGQGTTFDSIYARANALLEEQRFSYSMTKGWTVLYSMSRGVPSWNPDTKEFYRTWTYEAKVADTG